MSNDAANLQLPGPGICCSDVRNHGPALEDSPALWVQLQHLPLQQMSMQSREERWWDWLALREAQLCPSLLFVGVP